jgi:hypothetical protein
VWYKVEKIYIESEKILYYFDFFYLNSNKK